MGLLLEATKQIQNRLPGNIELWRSLASFSPSAMFSQVKEPLCSLELLKLFKGDIGQLDIQYKSVNLVQWNTANDSNPEALWTEIYNYRGASRECAYGDLALFALSLLALPLSNTDVERFLKWISSSRKLAIVCLIRHCPAYCQCVMAWDVRASVVTTSYQTTTCWDTLMTACIGTVQMSSMTAMCWKTVLTD